MKKSEIKQYGEIPFTEASHTQPGDWVLVFGRNKKESTTNKRLKGTGASDFQVIESLTEKTKQVGNGRIRTMDGSISPNTIVKIINKSGL